MAPRPSRTVIATSLALVAPFGCGGSDAFDAFGPVRSHAAAVPSVSLTMIPSVGEHSFEWGPEQPSPIVRPRLSWSVDFTAPMDLAELWVRVRLLAEDGTACLLSASRVGRVAQGNRYIATGDRYELPDIGVAWQSSCSDAFTTAQVDVNLTDGPPLKRASPVLVIRGFVFSHFYFFHRTGFSPGNAVS